MRIKPTVPEILADQLWGAGLECVLAHGVEGALAALELNHRIDQALDQMTKNLAEAGPASLAARGDGGEPAEPH
ncbi:MAG: hypothetical protein JRH16_22210 [Deltaproteobacteria bacterium]|nr:hypothetical protein [Deltaproteobacteria bacterium]